MFRETDDPITLTGALSTDSIQLTMSEQGWRTLAPARIRLDNAALNGVVVTDVQSDVMKTGTLWQIKDASLKVAGKPITASGTG